MKQYFCIWDSKFLCSTDDVNQLVKYYCEATPITLPWHDFDMNSNRNVFLSNRGIVAIMFRMVDVWELPSNTKYIMHFFCSSLDDMNDNAKCIEFQYKQQFENAVVFFDNEFAYNDAIIKINNNVLYSKMNICGYVVDNNGLYLKHTKKINNKF